MDTISIWILKFGLSVTVQPVQYMPILGIHQYVSYTSQSCWLGIFGTHDISYIEKT